MFRLVCLLFLLIPTVLYAQDSDPVLNFSDLITGPDTGLNDGAGSGAIVTIWGQGLGSFQGNGEVFVRDASGAIRGAAHVYYWKNADGNLPGGPANLFESHKMQEIAFSLPDSALGSAEIYVEKNGRRSNSLLFTIRNGSIYHVRASGSDSAGNGSFNDPYRSVGGALDSIAEAGATVYVHDSLVSGSSTTTRAVYWNNTSASSGQDNQFAIIAFPNSQPSAIGISGFLNYNTAGLVVAKYLVRTSECREGSNGQPTSCEGNKSIGIQSSAFGRAVANNITDQVGGCSSGTQGAISGNAADGDRVSAFQILGNEVHDYGCEGSDKLHHTTYMSIRSNPDNLTVPPWRFAWNYLHGNKTKNGIHQYDENDGCGTPTGTVEIHNNVVVNQAGAGIFVGSTCGWANDWNIYNNLLINTGLASDWNGTDVSTANGPNTSAISVQDDELLGTVNIFNNTIIDWNGDGLSASSRACLGFEGENDSVVVIWRNNICSTSQNRAFIGAGFQAESLVNNVSGDRNIWFNRAAGGNASIPGWDANGLAGDPLITVSGAQVALEIASIARNSGNATSVGVDLYGTERLGSVDIGAVEFVTLDPPPMSPVVQ